jgi:hypothetical protein
MPASMTFHQKLFSLATLSIAIAGLGSAAGFNPDLRLKTSATWAENISRSSSSLDWTDAMTYEAAVTAGQHRQLADRLTGSLELEAAVLYRPEFRENDELSLGVRGELKQKFGLGPLAPVLTAEGKLAGISASMGGKDGWTAMGALSLSKRLTNAWSISVTGDWHDHYAASATFDARYQRFYGELTWDITSRWQLTYGYGRFWGDFTANASPVIWPRAIGGLLGPAINNYYNAMPWEVTNSYGSGWVTYRVYGESDLWWLQLSPALTDNVSLSLRYDSVFTINKVNVKYRSDSWKLSLLYNF